MELASSAYSDAVWPVIFLPLLHVEGNELNPRRLDTIALPLDAFEKRNVPPAPKIASQYVLPFVT